MAYGVQETEGKMGVEETEGKMEEKDYNPEKTREQVVSLRRDWEGQ
jgi:hypothetical protein